MRALGTIVLLTGGLSVAAYAYMPVASFNEHNLSRLVEIQSPTGRLAVPVALPDAPAASGRSFSPSTPLFARAAARDTSGAAGQPAQAPSSQPWRPIVTGDGASRPAASGGGDYVAQVALAREIQKELKRVGCYSGDADGDWKAASRRAMGSFLERLNAALPTDAPDHIMLTLLQSRAERVCGTPCSAGQTVGNDGQCLPGAIVADAPAARPARGPAAAVRASGAGSAELPTGSIAAAAPELEASRDRPTAVAPPRTRTAAVEVQGVPGMPRDVARPAARIAPDARAEPLPGRMSVGAPHVAAAASDMGYRNAPAAATAAPAPPADLISREAATPQRSWTTTVQPVRERAVRRATGGERAQRAERRQASSYQPRPRRKLTVSDVMRQINGF